MIYLDTSLLNLLNKHSINVKIEKNAQTKKDYFRLSMYSQSRKLQSILLWNFDIWFILVGLKNIYNKGCWSKQSYMTIIDAIVDQEMQQHPTNIGILLPYMSAQMRKKYASNIIGREFDM